MNRLRCPTCRALSLPSRVIFTCTGEGCSTTIDTTLQAGALPQGEDGPLLSDAELAMLLEAVQFVERPKLALMRQAPLSTIARVLNSCERKLKVYREVLTRPPIQPDDEEPNPRQEIIELFRAGRLSEAEVQERLEQIAQQEEV